MSGEGGAPERCPGKPGGVVPVIDRNRCEAKADCVAVCPYGVFEVKTLEGDDRAGLSLIGRLKAWAHGGRQAYVVAPDQCHACALCIDACPEGAIALRPGGLRPGTLRPGAPRA